MYDVDLMSAKPAGKVSEPFGNYANWAACKAAGKSDEECGFLKSHFEQGEIGTQRIADFFKTTEQAVRKYQAAISRGMAREMVDWSTYLTPGERGFIHGEMIHPLVSGNGVDYTMDELVPAVNTIIGKPIFKVPNAWMGPEHTMVPEDLHIDPLKMAVGSAQLVRYKNGAVNFLAKVDDDTWEETKAGKWPRGSIEADFMVKNQSTKNTADFKPEFIMFTGYLLLPDWAPPGDALAKNTVYETLSKKWSCQCPSKMLTK